MKNIYLLVFLVGYLGFGQKKENKKLLKYLVGVEWSAVSAEQDGEIKEVSEDRSKNFSMFFSPDGEHKVIQIKDERSNVVSGSDSENDDYEKVDGISHNKELIGSWELLKEENTIAITQENERAVFKIDKITKKELVLTINDNNKNLTIFFKKNSF